MLRIIGLAIGVAASPVGAQSDLQTAFALRDLTVSADHLPAGCELTGTGLLGVTNPWTGIDAPVIASIRGHMYGLPPAPDGPPLDRRGTARYLIHLADGVEEGYTALYRSSNANDSLTSVHALRFADSTSIPTRPRTSEPADDRTVTWLHLDPIVILVVGDTGECGQAIEAHVRSLAEKR